MRRLIKYCSIVLLAGAFTACNKLAEYNIDPNNPAVEQATPQLLFPSGVLSAAGQIHGQYAITGGIWAQYYTQSALSSQYRTIDAYALISTDNNLAYQELFRGALADFDRAQDLSRSTNNWPFFLMNTVMKAYTYQVLVDLYDQVPFTEALQGADNLQPKFDNGYDIYVALLKEIDSALAQNYKVTLNPSDQTADIVFGGDMDNWEAFANTLKLKMYLRMVNAKPTEAEAGIRSLYDANVPFLQTGAGVTSFVNKPNFSNPFYEQNIRRLNTTSNLRASVTLVSFLGENGDPRLQEYFGSANPGAIHQGDYASTNPAYGSAAVFVQSATDPAWFISAAESYFLQAEARVRYYASAGAKDLYDLGLSTAFAERGLEESQIPGTYAFPEAGTNEQKIEAIIVQKWASFPGTHDLEGWFEINRTGYPKTSTVYSTDPSYVPGQLVYSANGVTGGLFPKRLLFPDLERSRNANTPAEVPITTKVWWAK